MNRGGPAHCVGKPLPAHSDTPHPRRQTEQQETRGQNRFRHQLAGESLSSSSSGIAVSVSQSSRSWSPGTPSRAVTCLQWSRALSMMPAKSHSARAEGFGRTVRAMAALRRRRAIWISVTCCQAPLERSVSFRRLRRVRSVSRESCAWSCGQLRRLFRGAEKSMSLLSSSWEAELGFSRDAMVGFATLGPCNPPLVCCQASSRLSRLLNIQLRRAHRCRVF